MKDAEELRTIVDDNNNIIGYKMKKNMTRSDFYRVSALRIKNSKWQVLLAQRSWDKLHDPWKWWPAVAWTVRKWEDFDEVIVRETEEEIWLKIKIEDLERKELKKTTWEYTYFNQRYLLVIDRNIEDFVPAKDELESLKWRDVDVLKNELKNNPSIFLHNLWEKLDILA